MKFVDKVFERVARGGVFERVVAIPHGESGEILAFSRQIDNSRGPAGRGDFVDAVVPGVRAGEVHADHGVMAGDGVPG